MRLCAGQDIDMHLTAKGDGSLLVINSFTGESLAIMEPVVNIFGSDYARIWAKQSLELSNQKRLLVPSTQGTLMESGFMAGYMVTSMLVGSGIVTREELEAYYKTDKTYDNLSIFLFVRVIEYSILGI